MLRNTRAEIGVTLMAWLLEFSSVRLKPRRFQYRFQKLKSSFVYGFGTILLNLHLMILHRKTLHITVLCNFILIQGTATKHLTSALILSAAF